MLRIWNRRGFVQIKAFGSSGHADTLDCIEADLIVNES